MAFVETVRVFPTVFWNSTSNPPLTCKKGISYTYRVKSGQFTYTCGEQGVLLDVTALQSNGFVKLSLDLDLVLLALLGLAAFLATGALTSAFTRASTHGSLASPNHSTLFSSGLDDTDTVLVPLTKKREGKASRELEANSDNTGRLHCGGWVERLNRR